MRVDMVERVAMLVRTAARKGHLKLQRICCLWRGHAGTDGADALDLNCVVVGEEAARIRKPAVQILSANAKHRCRKMIAVGR